MKTFEHRGVIEGFYGEPYSAVDRSWLVEKLGSWGMNRYVYAPKDDPLHRAEWRTPYPTDKMREFAGLIDGGQKAVVDVGFAISPGLSIQYAAPADVSELIGKFRAFRDIGARFFGLALDDVPSKLVHAGDRSAFGSLGAAHVALAHAVAEGLGPDSTLWLVPTDYLGVESTDYLAELGATLDESIEVGWTGRTVVSPSIPAGEAEARARCLRRRLLLWDNTPVSDGPMRPMLHLGPYSGRDPRLAEHASGVLLNPMKHARASALTLRCAADYLRDPEAYVAEASWRAAVDELGAGAPEAFASFAAAHRFSALRPEDRDEELEAAFRALERNWEGGAARERALCALVELVAERKDAAETLRARLTDRALIVEIEPWLASHEAESRRIASALQLLQAFVGDAPRMNRVLAFFVFEGTLTGQPIPPVASYGPRRVVYPQLVSMRLESAGFGADTALFRNRCLADEIVAFAEQRALIELSDSAR